MIKKLSFDDFLLMTTRERENKEPEKKEPDNPGYDHHKDN